MNNVGEVKREIWVLHGMRTHSLLKYSARILRPIEVIRIEGIFQVNQPFGDQKAEEEQGGDEPVEDEKHWGELFNKRDKL